MKKVIQYYFEAFEGFEIDMLKSYSSFESFPSRILANLRKPTDSVIVAFGALNQIVQSDGQKKRVISV